MEKQVLNKVKGKRLYTKLKRNLSLSNIMSSSIEEKNTTILLLYQLNNGVRISSNKAFSDRVIPNSRTLLLSLHI